MATVIEGWEGRLGAFGKSTDLPYIVFDAADEDEVRTACLAAIPTTYNGLPRSEIEITERLNATTWRVVARYRKNAPPPDQRPESRFEFDTSGGTQHITQSRATVARYGPKASTRLQGAIGFDGKNVQGCDIVVPVYNWAETHYFDDDEVTDTYKATLFNLTGCKNGSAWKNFAAGEVLFLGASGARQGTGADDWWEITFRFASSPNRQNFSVGDITGIDKKGWDYMWVQYGDEADDATSQVVKKPVAVYIEEVYPDGDFSQLGIGT